jgi:hypothetical protein
VIANLCWGCLSVILAVRVELILVLHGGSSRLQKQVRIHPDVVVIEYLDDRMFRHLSPRDGIYLEGLLITRRVNLTQRQELLYESLQAGQRKDEHGRVPGLETYIS